MKIQVTQEDIDAGKPETCDACPIALAMKRAGLQKPSVEDIVARWETPGRNWGWGGMSDSRLPHEARDFIAAFDDRKPVVPFEFELEVES